MITLSTHARTRIIERAIAWEWVEITLADPDWTTPDVDPALTRSYKAIEALGGRVLKVVHRADGADTLVVTAHFDRSARP